ncbi:MAG: flagellar motor protein [Pseudomonadales bacterium]|nr:flagellar motor protein [Pseudomonadales bacterium]
MDRISILGLMLGFLAIVGGQILEGGHLGSLSQPTALLIVVGGTLGAVMLQSPYATFVRGIRMAKWIWRPPVVNPLQLIQQVSSWSQVSRREGLLALDAVVNELPDEFTRKGLQLLVDGSEPETIRTVLESESWLREQRDVDAAKFYESMGGYAPTIGIIGAVVGLIHVMGNLEDPGRVGPGIAVAFVATIYGVALANLFFLPIASKLRSCVREAAQYREMIIEGIIAIADGENPRSIEMRLTGYLG